jgi:glucose/arabinose dehydrogenase
MSQRTTASPRPTFRPKLEILEDRLTPSTLPPGFVETQLAGGIPNPTAMEIAPDGRIFVLDQSGNVRIVEPNGGLRPTPFLSLNVDFAGERGLLGIAFDPNFEVNQYVYVYYTTSNGTVSHNRVSRFTANGDTVVPGSEKVLLDLDNLSSATNHNGGGIHFGLDGKLYIGVGENANGANSQTTSNLLGKMLRINSDGSIPTDNPFYNTATGNNRAIWAIGLRNPFTFAVQPGTGRIFINDVGQSTWEEIDDGIAGANYGWPNAEGNSTNPAYTNPLLEYGHGSGNALGAAIVGGAFYNPPQSEFPSSFMGLYFYSDLGNNWIRTFDPSSGTSTLFASNTDANKVDLKVDAAGRLYSLARGTGGNTGTLVRVSYGTLTADEQFVRSLYQDCLGRAGSMNELDSWLPQLASLGRPAVANAIAKSHEAHLRLIGSDYSYFLGRSAGAGEGMSWVNALDQGATAEQIATGMLNSPEFASRANALEGTGDANTNYVRALYDLLLRRAGSAADVAGWVNQLGSHGRDGVAQGFLLSMEFRDDIVQTMYGQNAVTPLPFVPNLLKRLNPPAASDVQGWVNTGADLLTLEQQIATSNEYYLNG